MFALGIIVVFGIILALAIINSTGNFIHLSFFHYFNANI